MKKPTKQEAEVSYQENLVFTRSNCAQFPMERNYRDAIRRKCLDCCCGNGAVVRECEITDCALWPFRFGNNPFTSRSQPEAPSEEPTT